MQTLGVLFAKLCLHTGCSAKFAYRWHSIGSKHKINISWSPYGAYIFLPPCLHIWCEEPLCGCGDQCMNCDVSRPMVTCSCLCTSHVAGNKWPASTCQDCRTVHMNTPSRRNHPSPCYRITCSPTTKPPLLQCRRRYPTGVSKKKRHPTGTIGHGLAICGQITHPMSTETATTSPVIHMICGEQATHATILYKSFI